MAPIHVSHPCVLLSSRSFLAPLSASTHRAPPALRRPLALAASATLTANSVPQRNGVYTVGDFMTRKEELHVVKNTTAVDEALEMLVENRITGFPVIDHQWKLVGLASDYDLLVLDSISGGGRADNNYVSRSRQHLESTLILFLDISHEQDFNSY